MAYSLSDLRGMALTPGPSPDRGRGGSVCFDTEGFGDVAAHGTGWGDDQQVIAKFLPKDDERLPGAFALKQQR